MSMPLQLVFFGELIEGFSVGEVRRNLAQSFNLGDEQLDRMFGGNAVVLKRNLSDSEAARYVAHLASLGARAQMRPMPGAANTPTFKVEASAAAPLPTLIASDGPRDVAPLRPDPVDPWQGVETTRAHPVDPWGDVRSTRSEAVDPWGDVRSTRAEAVVPLRPAEARPVAFTPATAPSASASGSRGQAPTAFAPTPASFSSSPSSLSAKPAPFAPPAASPFPHAPALPFAIEPIKPRKAEVACPKCGERQPMSLLCRNCATNLEMALAARAEDDRAARAERIDATRARHGLPPMNQSASGTGAGHARTRTRAGADDPPPLWGVGWDGRIGRLNFATGMVVLWALQAVVAIVVHRMPGALAGTLTMLAYIAMFAMSLRQSALRFHDRGHSGWLNLLWSAPYVVFALFLISPRIGMRLLIPAVLVYVAVAVYLLFFPGDGDDNEYGSTPREGSGGVLLGAIVAFFAMGAMAPDNSPFARLRNAGQDDTTVAERLRSVEAKRAYMTEYLLAIDHKAFAASPDGSWGWVAEARTDDDAMTEALGTCEKHRPPTQRACELVSVNGRPVGIN